MAYNRHSMQGAGGCRPTAGSETLSQGSDVVRAVSGSEMLRVCSYVQCRANKNSLCPALRGFRIGALQRGPGGPWPVAPTQNFGWVGHNAFVPTNNWPVCLLVKISLKGKYS